MNGFATTLRRARALMRPRNGLLPLAALFLLIASPGAEALGPYDLLVSASPDRSSAQRLDGSAQTGAIYVFTSQGGTTDISKVDFWLDNPQMTGTPRKTETGAPYDFAGTNSDAGRTARPFDTKTIADGSHTITAKVTHTNGTTASVTATFTVQNTGPAPPPTPSAPDQVHLAWVGDPSTTLTVVWRTKETSVPSTVEYRKKSDPTWTSATGARRTSGTTGMLHEVKLTGLSPSTAYEYRVRGPADLWSDVFETRTAPPPGPADFDFVYVADTGLIGRTDGLATGTKQVIDEIVKQNPLFVLGGGDYAYYSTDKRYGSLDNTIDAWFNQMQPVAAASPLMPAYGNHEALLSERYEDWAPRFATPTGHGGFDSRQNYSFDVGDVHFVSIFAVQNSIGLTTAQLQWIEQDIQAAKTAGKRWIIPFFHVSPFADGKNHPSNLELRGQLGPLFERLGVKLAISSHDQAYERSYPLKNVTNTSWTVTSTSKSCYTTNEGVTWVKVSPGGKLSNISGNFSPFATTPAPSWTAVRDNTIHHFARVRVFASGSIVFEDWGVKGDGSAPILKDTFQYTTGSCTTGPALSFTPDALSLSATQGGSAASQTVTVDASNAGGAAYSLTDDAAWLTVSPASGTTPGTITATASPAGLPPGTYTANVTASADGYTGDTLPVTFKVDGTATSSYQLLMSTSSNRSNPVELAGKTASGNIYVFTKPDSGDYRVRFFLDDPQMQRAPRKIESSAPYDFAGGTTTTASPFDTRTIANGQHTITAAVDLSAGGTQIVNAAFTVANGTSSPPPPPPPPPPSSTTYNLLVSTSSNRSSPSPLAGKTASGNIYVFTKPDSGVYRVRFFLDDPQMQRTPRRIESSAPYDFAGGTTTTASPFDTRTIANGQHTITAAVEKTGGGTEVLNASFTVAN